MGSCVSVLNKTKKSKGSNTLFPPKPLSYEEVVLEQNEEENREEGYVAIPMEEKLPEINDVNEPQGENSASDDNNGVVDGDQVGKSVDSVAHDHEVEKSIEEEEEKEVVVEARVNYGITATTTT